jgi:thiol-disulfide isomerase/thioredoxin
MKNSKYLIFLLSLFSSALTSAQEAEPVIQKYQAATANIKSIHYQVEQLDTFVTGTVWNHKGQVTLLRKTDDPLFGFQYKAAKGVGGEALYDGISDFQIDHKKQTYELTSNPQSYILGSPGGQLVVPELMAYQDPEVRPALLEEDQHFILHYSYPDLEEYDVRQREKKIYLDKTTFLPVKVIKRQVTLDKKQVITRIISDIHLNRPEDQDAIQKDFLSNYRVVVEEPEEDLHADLLTTKVKDFQLETFAGAQISTRPKQNRLLLIDFWEVWCGPCLESMPKVQALSDKYGSEGLDVVGVLMDPQSQDSAEKLIHKKSISFTQALGNEALRQYFRVHAIPQYVLIDQNGMIQKVYQGYNKAIEKDIKKLLAKAQ